MIQPSIPILSAVTALLLLPNLGCQDTVTDSTSSCEASIDIHLLVTRDGYGFDATITNTGTGDISTLEVPFTLHFTNKSSDSRDAYAKALGISPRESKRVALFISPANQNPYNPRYIAFTGKTIDRVEYSDPRWMCSTMQSSSASNQHLARLLTRPAIAGR